MHATRIVTFLLGIWLGCSVMMDLITLQTPNLPDQILSNPHPEAQKIIQASKGDGARLLLDHAAREEVRYYTSNWELIQIPLGFLTLGALYFATERRLLANVLAGLMLVVVLFQYFAITPELTYRGREADFPPGSLMPVTVEGVKALTQVYVGVEGLKIVIGGLLASVIFAQRSRRRTRKEDLLSEAERVTSLRRNH